MNSDLHNLIELEKVDREIARLTDEIAALPRRVAEIEGKLADDKAAVEKARQAIKNNEANRRKYESDIQACQQKIVKYRGQSSSVKTNDEYRALMHEVEFAEKEISGCEDKILELMISLENDEKKLKAAEADLKAESVAVEKEKEEARKRTATDEDQLKTLNAQRTQLRGTVGDSALAHYDRVLRQRKTAIAEAREQKCQTCFVMVRPQTWEELKTNEQIITCSSCGRILYYDPAHAPALPPEAAKKKRSRAADAEPEAEATTETAPEISSAQ
ncbi:MAG TPA: C4-type zinc ribbon domain-containing protein [Candidatus Limnocylindrales bacterium]|jgi:predicted  nucleic acid-binding Zn-ribbon protein|nr:C4-type zinc ribbon domain-containing protein [Candidatus Limnocylindrales bacterium]